MGGAAHRHPGARGAPGWRWPLVVVLVFVSFSAVFGAVGLMSDGMGMPIDWLERTPFVTWTLPGVALVVTVALPQAFGAWAVLVRRTWAPMAAMVVGAALVGWIVVQLLVLQRYFFLQPVIAGFGALEMLLAEGLLRRSTV